MCGKRHDLEAASIAIGAGLECHACLARTSKGFAAGCACPGSNSPLWPSCGLRAKPVIHKFLQVDALQGAAARSCLKSSRKRKDEGRRVNL